MVSDRKRAYRNIEGMSGIFKRMIWLQRSRCRKAYWLFGKPEKDNSCKFKWDFSCSV